MTVSEVREVMRRGWAANAPLLALIYAHDAHPGRSAGPAMKELQSGRGPSADAFRQAYNMFFLQVGAGPPCMRACSKTALAVLSICSSAKAVNVQCLVMALKVRVMSQGVMKLSIMLCHARACHIMKGSSAPCLKLCITG